MSWHFLPQKNKSVIRYLLIVLAFALLACSVYVFFKFKIEAIEEGNGQAYQTTQRN